MLHTGKTIKYCVVADRFEDDMVTLPYYFQKEDLISAMRKAKLIWWVKEDAEFDAWRIERPWGYGSHAVYVYKNDVLEFRLVPALSFYC